MNVSRYVKVAAFFITLGVAGSAYIIISADGISDFNTRVYEAVLPDATGLSTRSKVYLAGVAVGRVRNITLENNEARLKVAFLKDVEIRSNARIARRSSSILGTSVLYLDPGTELAPIVPPGSRINTDENTADMGAVLGTVQEVGGQITQLLRDFQDNQLALLSISLETFNSIARQVDERSGAELERVSRILESTALITERLEGLLAGGAADSGSAGDVYAALENIRRITDEIRRGDGNLGMALYDDQLYAGLLAATRKIDDAAAKLQNALDSINTLAINADGVVTDAGIIVKKAVGLGVEVDAAGRYDMIARQIRAGASIRLAPASNDRWYRVGVNSAPDGVVSRTVKEVDDSSTGITIKDTTETRYSVFTVDAELARRFGVLTLHGGLLENTAGLGIDIQPIRWASMSWDVFNFRKDERPNLRGTLTIYPFFDPASAKPWNWIYLRGGVTNVLVDERDYFVGAGLRFTDTEIKGLVGLVPALNN
jgi:phospholipid/cholesterol/gamma-HCH transport system substrate-binding protein